MTCPDALTQLRLDAQTLMTDRCKIGTSSTSSDGVYTVDSFSYGSEIHCGYSEKQANETTGAQSPVVVCSIRIPFGTTVSESSMIQLTKRSGEVLTSNNVYRINGIQRHDAWIRCNVEKVTGNGR